MRTHTDYDTFSIIASIYTNQELLTKYPIYQSKKTDFDLYCIKKTAQFETRRYILSIFISYRTFLLQ